ncbi:hypothetical protein KBC79_03010 [Candidatus Woesebacteria bacterium]|nr:hypothetical protein [Candidatus Woesebacteria bacterium]
MPTKAKKTTKPKTKTAQQPDQKQQSTEKPLIIDNTVISLKIDVDTANRSYQEALKHMAAKLKAPGFRQGKVPTDVAENLLKPTDIIQHALEHVVPEVYEKTVKEEKKEPLTHPEFKIITAEKGLAWEIEAHIAEAPTIDLKNYQKIVAQAKQTAEESEKKTSKQTKSADDTSKSEVPEQTAEQKEQVLLQHIYQTLLTELRPQIAELLVKEEIRSDFAHLRRQLDQMKISLEKFLELRKISIDDLTNQLAAEALGKLQLSFLIAAIAREAKLTVEQSDLDESLAKISDPELKKQQQDPMYRQILAQTILRRKVKDHLLSL